MGEESPVRVTGWVSETRELGKNLRFIVLRNWDGKVQLTLKRGQVPEKLFQITEGIPQESVIEASGVPVKEKVAKTVDLEIVPKTILVHSTSLRKLPLDPNWKVKSLLATRLDNRPLDLRRPEIQAIFKIEASLIRGFIEWLDSHDFLRVFTPALIGGFSESGADVFEVEHFGEKAYLRQDPQLHRQLAIMGGLEKIYDIGTNWRAEPSHTTRHMSEFRSLAVEKAFISSEVDTMRLQEQVVVAGISRVLKERRDELDALGVDPRVPGVPFPELRFPEIYEVLEELGKEVPHGSSYDSQSEKLLGDFVKERYNSDFFYVNKFPFKEKPFYVMKDGEPWARSVDLLYKGLELSSGGQREHRYKVLTEQIRQKGLDPRQLEWFTEFFRYGAPPHGGFALGVERMMMQMLELKNIREAALFPRDPERILP